MKIKKLLFLSTVALLIVAVSITTFAVTTFADTNQSQTEEESALKASELPEKHLILNADGSYGGSVDLSKYGEGAPLNGALDHPEAGYWKINDYYNARSTETRTMIHNFRGYQQTMANTDGLACVLMALNLFGYDTERTYNELNLVRRYQQDNDVTVKGNGVTAEGLQNMLSKMGIFSFTENFKKYSRSADNLAIFIKECLNNNQIMLLPFCYDSTYKWYAVVGVDPRGATQLILADPFDAHDHYQDGYRTVPASQMIAFWMNPERDIYIPSGASKETYVRPCENLVIQCPEGFTLDITKGPEILTKNDVVPEVHLLPHYGVNYPDYPNGVYRGQMADENGVVRMGGSSNIFTSREDDPYTVKDSVYHNFIDWYNMDDEGTRLLLHNYRAKIQTTASTCGVCSTLSALVYLGVPYDEMNYNLNDYSCTGEFKIMRQIENAANITVYNRGVANYEISKILSKYGMKALHSDGYNMTNYLKGTESKVYSTPKKMFTQLKTDLTNDNPFLIGWISTGGHWQVIIGYDDMGTESLYDDFCLLADSSDFVDHLVDGYDQFSALCVYNHWYNGAYHWNQQGLGIARK